MHAWGDPSHHAQVCVEYVFASKCAWMGWLEEGKVACVWGSLSWVWMIHLLSCCIWSVRDSVSYDFRITVW